MLEYLPWSQKVLDECLVAYKKGQFSVLDIDLGGECNFSCIYCDSPDRDVACRISIKTIERLLQSRQIKWIHICGIGEPTFAKNYNMLLAILKLCETYGIRCNMFSNIYNLTDELVEYIDKGILYVLFKIDTLSISSATNLYGIDTAKAQKQVENIKKLTKHAVVIDGCTNLAASLVPTRFNLKEIVSLINSMIECNVFPMIGDLENSGRGREHFEALNLSEDKLKNIKDDISKLTGVNYFVPQCPAVISSIHISTDNEIIVDEFSGLSCNWFWLEEPKLKTIASLSENTSLEEISEILLRYRKLKLPAVKAWLESNSSCITTFGGCGGDIISLLNAYFDTQGGVLKC